MRKIEQTSSFTQEFYEGIQEINPKNDSLLYEIEDSVRQNNISYILDFTNHNFRYVPDRDLFLCGHSPEEVKLLGYDFYSEIVHENDLQKFKQMQRCILKRLVASKNQGDALDYFSFNIRIKNYPQITGKQDYLMVCHRLTPVFAAGGQILFGICKLTISMRTESGNLCKYYEHSLNFDQYSNEHNTWTVHKNELTEREISILKFAAQGLKNDQLAAKFYIQISTLEHINTEIFMKLGVHSMEQAISIAMENIFLFDSVDKTKIYALPEIKKTRAYHPLSPENLLNAQALFDNGQSINAIARTIGVSPGNISNAIKDERLKKKD